jgi:aryl-alcohol dehydrogenase-like predicted oxidoreductase
MNRRALGPTGLKVHPVGLGGMQMSLAGRPPEEQSIETIHAAIDAGVDFIDTADVYCIDQDDIGHNERLIAKALRAHPRGSEVVVATKGGLQRPKGAWTRNGTRRHLLAACEASCKALGVEQITLYQLHAVDEMVPLTESLGALADLQKEGKIRHIGLSNVTLSQLEAARKMVQVVSVQNKCSPFDRRAWQQGIVQYCEREGIAFLPWGPIGGSRGKESTATDPVLCAVGQRHGVSPFRVALAWLLARSPAMIVIPGASKPRNAVDCANAMHLELTPQDMAQLDAAFPT